MLVVVIHWHQLRVTLVHIIQLCQYKAYKIMFLELYEKCVLISQQASSTGPTVEPQIICYNKVYALSVNEPPSKISWLSQNATASCNYWCITNCKGLKPLNARELLCLLLHLLAGFTVYCIMQFQFAICICCFSP